MKKYDSILEGDEALSSIKMFKPLNIFFQQEEGNPISFELKIMNVFIQF
jgi:hypothetical protein